MENKRLISILSLLIIVIGVSWAITEAPIFKYIPPQAVAFWSPPPEFGPIPAKEWKPPKGYEKYAQPWSPPDWWGEPGQWSPPPELN